MDGALSFTKALLQIMAEISAGVVLGQFIEALGWTDRLGALTRPLLAVGKLPRRIGLAFTTAFVSGSAANSCLVGWRDRRWLTDRQVAVGAVLNSFPNQFNHLPSQFAPMALVLGPRVAGAYFGTQIGAGLVRTLATLLWARRFAAGPPGTAEADDEADATRTGCLADRLRRAWRNSARTLRRVLAITLPVCAAFLLLNRTGAFAGLQGWVRALPGLDQMAPEASAVVVAHLASLLTAAAAAAELLRTGVLDERTVTLVLLGGSLLAMPVRSFRHSMGVYVGVFGPIEGLRIQLMTQGLRLVFGVLGMVALALLWR